jgi:heme-degrading monooxygenase HmoA
MPLLVHTWDLPFTKADMEWYRERGGEWVPTVLRQPGVVEFRAYRNPTLSSPQVMVHSQFATMADLQRWMASDEYRRIMGELRGCGNISVAVWDDSPVVPHARRPDAEQTRAAARSGS